MIKRNKNNQKKIKIIFVFATSLFLLIGIVYFWRAKAQLAATDYQAVFLDNNQVYFGKIKDVEKRYVILTDVYYFGRNDNSGNDSDVSLIKLGKELHSPKDKMMINRDHILYIEDMTKDSKVIQAIMEYKK